MTRFPSPGFSIRATTVRLGPWIPGKRRPVSTNALGFRTGKDTNLCLRGMFLAWHDVLACWQDVFACGQVKFAGEDVFMYLNLHGIED